MRVYAWYTHPKLQSCLGCPNSSFLVKKCIGQQERGTITTYLAPKYLKPIKPLNLLNPKPQTLNLKPHNLKPLNPEP